MFRTQSIGRWAALLVAVAILAGASGMPARAEQAGWSLVPSPNQGTRQNALKGIAAVAADDVCAVGEWNPGMPPTETGRRTLVEHWDGTSWQIVASPNPTWPGMDLATLEDVAAVAPDGVWAVGYSEDFASLRSLTLILHWDRSAWSIVPSPNPAGRDLRNRLYGIAAVTNSVWAVGEMGVDRRPLVLRWNGARWQAVANPCGLGLERAQYSPGALKVSFLTREAFLRHYPHGVIGADAKRASAEVGEQVLATAADVYARILSEWEPAGLGGRRL